MTELTTIPPYTQDDFYNSSAPYDFLYSFSNDKFLLGQMVQRVKAYAQSIGVKGFISLWNAYKANAQSNERSQIVSMGNGTEFDGQPIELFCGKYICQDDGVVGMDRIGNPVTVCVHPIMPVKRFVNVDTGDERIEVAFKKGLYWRSVAVPKSVISSPSGIIQLADKGVAVNARNANDLSTYLLEMEQFNYDLIPEQKSIGRLGWIAEHGFAPFVDGLAFDGDADFQNLFSSIRQVGSFEEWRKAMLRLRQQKTIGRLALAASFASVLVEPCGLLPFILHLHGTTEFGKTVSLMIAASVWGRPEVGEFITTFNSTSAGLEMLAGFLNSLPLCIDELEIQETQGVKDFDKIIYQLCEGAGKTRSTKTGGLQKIGRWRNCVISTGETTITHSTSKAGAVNRIISVEGTEKVIDPDYVQEFCDILRQNYGWAGRMFIDYLQSDGGLENVKILQKAFYKELLSTDAMDKQAASASAILTADYIVSSVILRDEEHQLTIDDIREIMAKKDEVDLNRRTLEYIYDLLVRQQSKFETNQWGDYAGEIWGKTDETYIYIIKSVFDQVLSDAGFHPNTFLSWARRQDILRKDAKDKNTVPVRIGSSIVRCVAIKKPVSPSNESENVVL